MKIEKDLKIMASFLQAQLRDVRQLLKMGKKEEAREMLEIIRKGIMNFSDEVHKADGAYFGIIGLFRHPYHVPEEIKVALEKIGKDFKELTKKVK